MQTLKHHSYEAAKDAKNLGVCSTWGQGRVGPKAWKDARCLNTSLAGVMMVCPFRPYCLLLLTMCDFLQPDVAVAPGDTDVEGTVLMYNEYICYDVAQVQLRYLLRVRM